MAMSIVGGLLIYGTIISFGLFLKRAEESMTSKKPMANINERTMIVFKPKQHWASANGLEQIHALQCAYPPWLWLARALRKCYGLLRSIVDGKVVS